MPTTSVIYYGSQPGSITMHQRVPIGAAALADDLARRIRAGEFEPGGRLPSHAELVQEYRVAYATVSRAISRLKTAGLVVSNPGGGVYVAPAEPGSSV